MTQRLLNNLDHLDLTIANETRRTESALCAISGEMFDKESVPRALLVPKNAVALSVGSIKIDQKVRKCTNGGQKQSLMYKMYANIDEEVSLCEQI